MTQGVHYFKKAQEKRCCVKKAITASLGCQPKLLILIYFAHPKDRSTALFHPTYSDSL
jgi:hypothetical protein